MYFWKVDDLVEDFRNDRVTQKEEFKYLLATSILGLIVYDTYFFDEYQYTYYDTVTSIVFLFITIAGIYYCYKKNEMGDNKDYIVRMTCLGFPIWVRLLVLYTLFLSVLALVDSIFHTALFWDQDGYATSTTDPIYLFVTTSCEFFYFTYLFIKIGEVAKKSEHGGEISSDQ